ELADFLAEALKGLGLATQVLPSEKGRHANVLATLGPPDTPGLMLAGHTDVVPVEGQAWDSDPFVLLERGGKFYGRGSADMKSFIAQCLLAAQEVRHRKFKVPLHLAFTYDEEVTCSGATALVKHLKAAGQVLPRGAVIGEPTNFQVFTKHKGITGCKVTIRGVDGHSSKPHLGANAIVQAALVIQKLVEVGEERRGHRSRDADFDVPYTTVNVGKVSGGIAFNVIPGRCELYFDYRTMPGEDPEYVFNQIQGYVQEELLPRFRQQHPDVDIRLERFNHGIPMQAPPGSAIEALALELTGNTRTGAAPYYTEGAIYNENGIPTVICGPGDIDQAHRPNEYITREQLDLGVPFLGRLISRVCLS
ncbi:MAG TPA: acetylornithine deacetylase, partial [bacterium]|nr:acetylornithine deacetylase [bacterium]